VTCYFCKLLGIRDQINRYDSSAYFHRPFPSALFYPTPAPSSGSLKDPCRRFAPPTNFPLWAAFLAARDFLVPGGPEAHLGTETLNGWVFPVLDPNLGYANNVRTFDETIALFESTLKPPVRENPKAAFAVYLERRGNRQSSHSRGRVHRWRGNEVWERCLDILPANPP
jgi:hypothetical protein